MPSIWARAHVTPCIDRVRESKNKLKLFYRMFIKHFLPYSFDPRLEYMFKAVWNYCYLYQSDSTPFMRRSDFLSSWGYLRHLWTRD